MTAGRPLSFKSVEELQSKIDRYFDNCYKTIVDDKTGEETSINVRPLTITGLALDLDTDRKTLLNYEDKEEYFLTIKKAKLRIQNFAEEYLYFAKNPAGTIFNLKNNWGWVDKQEVSSTNVNLNTDVTGMTDEELQAELAKLR